MSNVKHIRMDTPIRPEEIRAPGPAQQRRASEQRQQRGRQQRAVASASSRPVGKPAAKAAPVQRLSGPDPAQMSTSERNDVITAAVSDGKIREERRAHYMQLWASHPQQT